MAASHTFKISWMLIVTMVCLDLTLSSFVQLEDDGGYKDIVIAISPSINENEGSALIIKLTNIFSKMSESLQKATSKDRHPLHIKPITFLVPPKWSSTPNQATYQTYLRADIRLVEDPESDGYPYIRTQQAGGCGAPGQFIQITPAFLKEDKNLQHDEAKQARLLLQHWIRYRYGVFPEESDDSHLYPKQYRDENGLQVTGCTKPNPWNRTCEDENPEKCSLQFDKSVVLETSLMDSASLQTHSFCDKLSHNPDAPTIHNTLCARRSVWEILNEHDDFSRNLPNPAPDKTVSSMILKAREIQAVLVVDRPLCQPGSQGLGVSETVRLAIGSFLKGMLPQTPMGIILSDTLGNQTIQVDGGLDSAASEWGNLCSAVQPNDNESDISTISTAINDGIQFLQTNFSLAEDGVLIVLANTNTTDKFKGLKTAIGQALTNGKRISSHLISYPPLKVKKEDLEVIRDFMKTSRWFNIAAPEGDECNLEAWKQIHNALREIVSHNLVDFQPNNVTRLSETLSPSSERHFSLSSSTSSATVSAHCCDQAISLEIDGTKHSLINTDTRTIISKESFKQDGSTLKVSHLAYVTIVENAPAASVTLVSLMVEQDKDEKIPVVVRASVRRGNSPLQNVNVIATLFSLEDGKETPLPLLDTGNGDPDTFANDGIYSRYVMPASAGIYKVVVSLDSVPTNYADVNGSPPLVFSSVGSYYFSAASADNPPSQIRDLRVKSLSHERGMTVQFAWTAPGSDYDQGTASKYEFKCSVCSSSLVDKDSFGRLEFQAKGLRIPSPDGAGATQTLNWSITYDSSNSRKVLFCAIQAQDVQGKTNLPSNVVSFQIFTPHPTTTSPHPTTTSRQPTIPSTQPTTTVTNDLTTKPSATAVAVDLMLETMRATRDAVIGGTVTIIVLLLILIGLLVYFKWGRRTFGQKQSDEADAFNLDSMPPASSQQQDIRYSSEPHAVPQERFRSPSRTPAQTAAPPKESAKSSSRPPAQTDVPNKTAQKVVKISAPRLPGQQMDNAEVTGQQRHRSRQADVQEPRNSSGVSSVNPTQETGDNIYINMEKPPNDSNRSGLAAGHATNASDENIYDDVAC